MAEHNDAGAAFEKEVAQMYRASGYRIDEHLQLGGMEFDIIASKSGFAGMDVRIAVECKFKDKGSVSNTEANKFINAFNAARHKHNLTFGVIVSNNGFSRTAQVAAEEHPQIRLLSKTALDDELLGVRTFLEDVSKSYRTDASNYITLSATGHDRRDSDCSDVASACVGRLLSPDSSFTLLLGDFGSGKTTIAERVHAELCRKYLTGHTSSFPVLLYLRTLDQSDSENNFIDQHLKPITSQLGIQQLDTLRKRGGLTFILDGYDEVATNASEEQRLRLSSRVMRLINRADRVLLTSRPTYFTSISELNDFVERLLQRDFAPPEEFLRPALRKDSRAQDKLKRQFNVMKRSISGSAYKIFQYSEALTYHINPLTAEDIVGYLTPHASMLKRRYGMTPQQVYEVLSGIYDITDLLTRPLLLEMFLTLLSSGELKLGPDRDDLGPAGLYGLYVNLHLTREWNLRRFLTPDERRAFARTLAVAILEAGGSLEATYESLSAIVRNGKSAFEPARQTLLDVALSDVVTDVRICAFINMTPNGRLEFSHKSFMEYFVAEVVINALSDKQPISILNHNLNYEILYFLGSFCVTWSEYILALMTHMRDFGHSQSGVYRTNLMVAILYCERESEGREYRDVFFSRIRLAKRDFHNCDFINISLQNGLFINLNFFESSFNSLELGGDAANISLRDCRGNISVPGSTERLEIENCRGLTLFTGESSRQAIAGGTIRDCKITLQEGAYNWTDMRLANSELLLEKGATLTLSRASLTKVTIQSTSSRIRQLHLGSGKLDKVTFDSVYLAMDAFVHRSLKFESCIGLLLVDDESHSTLAFSWPDRNKITRYRGFSVEGKLVFFDLTTFNSNRPIATAGNMS